MIKRPLYSKKIEKFIDKPLIKVITGVRRSGKSTILKLIQKELLKDGILENQILYINFESMQYYDIRTAKKLYDYVMKQIESDMKVYLFFDEIQLVDRWEEAINSFLVDFESDIYITGSNSNLLSSELSTLLTGRYIQFEIQPLSLKEVIDFNEFFNNVSTENNLLWNYIRRGGFPSIYVSEYDEMTAHMVIKDIYDSIVLRDVVQRYNIRNIELLDRIMRYIMDNVGNTFSAKRISDYFKNQHRRVDINTIYNYLEALQSSFIVHKVNRYDVHGKAILKTQEKYYLVDQGIQHAIFGYRDRNISGVLENIVFCELIRRDYKVYIGKFKDKEIDFIAEKNNQKIYIQVTYKMESKKTIDREFEPLLSLEDHYPKYVVSMDQEFRDNILGIQHIYIEDFILSDNYL